MKTNMSGPFERKHNISKTELHRETFCYYSTLSTIWQSTGAQADNNHNSTRAYSVAPDPSTVFLVLHSAPGTHRCQTFRANRNDRGQAARGHRLGSVEVYCYCLYANMVYEMQVQTHRLPSAGRSGYVRVRMCTTRQLTWGLSIR